MLNTEKATVEEILKFTDSSLINILKTIRITIDEAFYLEEDKINIEKADINKLLPTNEPNIEQAMEIDSYASDIIGLVSDQNY